MSPPPNFPAFLASQRRGSKNREGAGATTPLSAQDVEVGGREDTQCPAKANRVMGLSLWFFSLWGVCQDTAAHKGAAERDHRACIQAGRGGCPLRLCLRPDRVSGRQLNVCLAVDGQPSLVGAPPAHRDARGAEVWATVQSLATKPPPHAGMTQRRWGVALGPPSHQAGPGRWEAESGGLGGQPGAQETRQTDDGHGCSLPPAPWA